MERLALLWVDGEEVRLAAVPPLAATSVLTVADAVFKDGFVCFGVDRLEPVCEELDRLGFLWAADRRFASRTWADHLFEGIDPRLHARVHDALASVLTAEDGDLGSWAVLELAWFARATGEHPSTEPPAEQQSAPSPLSHNRFGGRDRDGRRTD